mmetsp:Transcript_13171/g.17219  ORF Transcript_13171/g.17219 Transcript_13171/m.17219 type:complete len:186 (+) Transcript_13171:112-669(+)
MGLLSILKKVKQKEREVRILVLGLDNAGKSCVIKKLCGEDISKVEPTLGFNIKTLEYGGYKLNIWDVGGQQTIRAYWRNYFERTDGLIWVVDSADKVRTQSCKDELKKLLMQEKLAGACVLILANKQDLEGSLSGEELSLRLGLNAFHFNNRHHFVQACSAVTGQGLKEGIDWIVQDISNRIFMY